MIAESLICLALNVYHEAKNQSFIGQVAVAQVVMNRVKDNRYPNNVCDVVKQGLTYKWKPSLPIKNRCQFSWYCDGKPDDITDEYTYNQLHKLAESLVTSNFKILLDITDGALYYHADYVKPKWSRKFERTVKIGRHIFYKRR